MQQITYSTYQIRQRTNTGLNIISEEDKNLISEYEINSTFIPNLHQIELHIYSLDDELLYTNPVYNNEAFLQGSETSGINGASRLTLTPENDAINSGFTNGDVKLIYNFINNLYSDNKTGPSFSIGEISSDRTEIRLITTGITDEDLLLYTGKVKTKLASTSYFTEFKLNFKNNNKVIGVNIDTQTYKKGQSVIVKLYEPLPSKYKVKDLLTVEEVISDSEAFQVYAEITTDEIKVPTLKGPNFSLDLLENTNLTSEYLNVEQLFNYPTENNYREVKSIFEEKGIELSIEYGDPSDFTHFSSQNERLRNFKYKLDLITRYQNYLDTTGSLNVNNSHHKQLIDSILGNFDHYDRHLYYESSSTSWPKSNNTIPYINDITPSTGSWWSTTITAASIFDNQNPHLLINSIPSYLRDDVDNENYSVFIHMLAQHFDNLWIYSKAVTDKYNNDNRLDKGIPKDLVQDVLKNFGVKLYTSNRSTQDLFKMFTGEFYQTGSEQIETFLTASNLPVSEENYRKEVYKRIYHNLPMLLKSKGTERGLRALLNSFGIPTEYSTGNHTGLKIRTGGGTDTTANFNFGPGFNNTGSLAKIRIDNTGSIVEGNTLSTDVSIVKQYKTYTDDINRIDIGYSPTDYIDKLLHETLLGNSFNIDEYIGDPNLALSSSYLPLVTLSTNALTAVISGSYDLQDFTRILKFYDNVVFKMVKDFVPARSNTNTGIIIKPHLLERNKIKQVQGTFFNDTITGSIAVGNYSGSHGKSFGSSKEKTTNYTTNYMTSGGLASKEDHSLEQAKFNGEISGSQITVSQTDFKPVNPFKYFFSSEIKYKINVEIFEAEPSPTPTPTPTLTPTHIPVLTPTPTPTIPKVLLTPTPTPTVTATPICYEYTQGGYDQGGTSYIDCDGISATASYNAIYAGGYEQNSFCAVLIISYTGNEPVQTGLCPGYTPSTLIEYNTTLPKTSSFDACRFAELTETRWHNGSGPFPIIADTCYFTSDPTGANIGGGFWGIGAAKYIETDSNGIVIGTAICNY